MSSSEDWTNDCSSLTLCTSSDCDTSICSSLIFVASSALETLIRSTVDSKSFSSSEDEIPFFDNSIVSIFVSSDDSKPIFTEGTTFLSSLKDSSAAEDVSSAFVLIEKVLVGTFD